MWILCFRIFGRPATEFLFEKVRAASSVPSCMIFRREPFCSCGLQICFELKVNFAFLHVWPLCRFLFEESDNDIGGTILHSFLTRIHLQLRILHEFEVESAFCVSPFLAALLQISFWRKTQGYRMHYRAWFFDANLSTVANCKLVWMRTKISRVFICFGRPAAVFFKESHKPFDAPSCMIFRRQSVCCANCGLVLGWT